MNPPVKIPTDAIVLVTNGTQPVPLQIIKQLLEYGCRVRTTTTWMAPASWLDELFSPYMQLRMFERVTLMPGHPNHKSFYRDAVKGVHAIVHTATIPRLNHSLQDVWSLTAESVVCMLEAAEREPSVRAFVYTSSMVAATPLVTPSDQLVTEDSWNARDPILALMGQGSPAIVRNSSLVRAEQALWQWNRERTPEFKVNVVSPANLIGQNFGSQHTTHWENWIYQLYHYGCAREEIPDAGPTQAHWYVDVQDVALLHVAAIFDPKVFGQRLQAWGCYRDWNNAMEVLQDIENDDMKVLRKIENSTMRYPRIRGDGVTRGQLYAKYDQVGEILERWKGTGSSWWKPFEETVKESVYSFRERLL
ncbi:hypothetical protein C8A00DRAFT_33701 [Chaetomidium leptoderma]|uniref:Uncharacterized protein n=1 Tax=Chaetomidium leptoderma TaxID=669021 RepID=A0AAN6VNH0_9PEZI|nr:hypothetical protein C8A00DRAFT_33701 [Chaetomidium leptoderma]